MIRLGRHVNRLTVTAAVRSLPRLGDLLRTARDVRVGEAIRVAHRRLLSCTLGLSGVPAGWVVVTNALPRPAPSRPIACISRRTVQRATPRLPASFASRPGGVP